MINDCQYVYSKGYGIILVICAVSIGVPSTLPLSPPALPLLVRVLLTDGNATHPVIAQADEREELGICLSSKRGMGTEWREEGREEHVG